jgi:Concanavalin A-like lectin/glucanases superfamily
VAARSTRTFVEILKAGANTYSKTGSVISAAVASGGEQKTLGRTGIGISAFAASGADASTHSRQNIAVVDNSILSGVDASTFVRKNIVISDNLIASGVDQSTFVRKNTVIIPNNCFTMEIWAKPDVVLTSGNSANGSYWLLWAIWNIGYFYMDFNSGVCHWGVNIWNINTGTWESLQSTTNPVAGNTYHLVATYDRATLRLYVNGTQENSAAKTFALGIPNIGGSLCGVGGGTIPTTRYDGKLDEVALYAQVLSPDEISAHYAGGSNYNNLVLAKRPALYARLGESAGTTVVNSSEAGSTNNGGYGGGFTLSSPGLVPGNSDTAVDFDGTGSVFWGLATKLPAGLVGVDASIQGRQNIVVIGNSILSGPKGGTFGRTGIAISAFAASGPDATTHSRQNIVIIDNSVLSGPKTKEHPVKNIAIIDSSILSGVDQSTFTRKNIAIVGNSILSGADANTFVRKNIAISDFVASAVDQSTFVRKNIVVIGNSIVSGVDQSTFVRKNIVISDNLILSGTDSHTAVRTGIVISAFAASGFATKQTAGAFTKTGIVISAFALSGPDASTQGRTGVAISDKVLSGADATTHGRTGIAISDRIASGIKAIQRIRTGIVISSLVASGGAVWSVGRKSIVIARKILSGVQLFEGVGHKGHARSTPSIFAPRQVTHSRKNAVSTDLSIRGNARAVFSDSGIVISPHNLGGGEVKIVHVVYSKTGKAISAFSAIASRIHSRNRTGTVKIDNSKASGVKLRVVPRTGKAIATFSTKGVDQHTAVRSAIVKIEAQADGTFQIDFNDNPELFEHSLLGVDVEAPELLEAVNPPGTLLDATESPGGLTSPRIIDAKTGR